MIMKRLIFTLAIVFGCTSLVSAQESGKIWVGGSVGVKTSKVKDGERLTNFNILPEAGYVFSNNWSAGIRLGYVHNEKEEMGQKMKLDGFSVKPFARYSFLKGGIGYLFVDGGGGYTYTKNKTTDTKVHEIEVGFRPGVAFNISDKIALTGRFGFLGYEYEDNGGRKTNTFGFDFDLSQIQLGMNIYF